MGISKKMVYKTLLPAIFMSCLAINMINANRVDKNVSIFEDARANDICKAVADGRLGETGRLLKKHVNPNEIWCEKSQKKPLLSIAAMKGHEKEVELLLDNGAHVNARSAKGWTPLMSAVGGAGRRGIVKLLIDNGADLKVKNEQGQTALKIALLKRDFELAQMLIDYGAGKYIFNGVKTVHSGSFFKDSFSRAVDKPFNLQCQVNLRRTYLEILWDEGRHHCVEAERSGENIICRVADDGVRIIKPHTGGMKIFEDAKRECL